MTRQLWGTNRKSEAERHQSEVVQLASEAAGPMTVGRYLRAQREERGEDLDQVADLLRIHRAYLQAIEADDVDRLPGPTYAVGFVRAYAEHLGLDGRKVVDRFKEETKGLETRTQLVFPSPLPEGRVPSGAILLLAMVFLAAAYGGWMYVSSLDTSLAEMVPSLPDRFAAFVGGDNPAAPEAPPPALAPGAAGRSDGGKPAETPSGDVVPPAEGPGNEGREPDDSSSTKPAPAAAPAAGSSETVAAAPSGDAAVSATAPADGASGAGAEPPAAAANPAPSGATTVASDSASATPGNQESEIRDGASTSASSAGGTDSGTASAPRDVTGGEASPQPQPQQAELPAVEETRTSGPRVTQASATAGEAMTTGGDVASYPPDPPLPTFRETPTVFGTENAGGRIVILAVGDSWVEVRDRSGALLLTRVLRTGDRYQVPDQPGLTLVTGNAGGLEISVDGTTVPSIGPVGTVRRNVALDPDALKNGTAHLN